MDGAAMDKLRVINRLRALMPTLPADQRHTLTEFVHGSELTFSYVCEPQHQDAYRLFCQLISSGESMSPFCDRHMSLLAMMQGDDSFEEFRKLVSSMLRREETSLSVIGRLAAKVSFRRMFRQLLQDGWLLPREEDATTCKMMELLHAEFAYQEGCGPKPLVCVSDNQEFVSILEEDEREFQSMSLHEPESNTAKRIADFFAEHPGATWKQASKALSMSVHSLKRHHKKEQSNTTVERAANREHQETCELKTSMSREALHQTAYTQITFANGTSTIFVFEPSERGRVLWSEWIVSHPFPTAVADMNLMIQSKWHVFTESEIYRGFGPEQTDGSVVGRLLQSNRGVGLFSQAENQELYNHDLQRELYDLACPWYNGGQDSIRAAQRIKDIGQELYQMGEDAIHCQDSSDVAPILSIYAHSLEMTGRLPKGISLEQFTNARRAHGLGHAAMTLHFIGLGVLTGVFDEVTKTPVPASRHSLPATEGGIMKMHHTKQLREELEITGWQCVVEMLWHGIGQWEN
mmetsp:Transcript_126540/g.252914  ORF Transcript_126540/g.252914 Transcript_126540/m.252914 type:complete len:519 (+) Transcript_126540:75-1631(+)